MDAKMYLEGLQIKSTIPSVKSPVFKFWIPITTRVTLGKALTLSVAPVLLASRTEAHSCFSAFLTGPHIALSTFQEPSKYSLISLIYVPSTSQDFYGTDLNRSDEFWFIFQHCSNHGTGQESIVQSLKLDTPGFKFCSPLSSSRTLGKLLLNLSKHLLPRL